MISPEPNVHILQEELDKARQQLRDFMNRVTTLTINLVVDDFYMTRADAPKVVEYLKRNAVLSELENLMKLVEWGELPSDIVGQRRYYGIIRALRK